MKTKNVSPFHDFKSVIILIIIAHSIWKSFQLLYIKHRHSGGFQWVHRFRRNWLLMKTNNTLISLISGWPISNVIDRQFYGDMCKLDNHGSITSLRIGNQCRSKRTIYSGCLRCTIGLIEIWQIFLILFWIAKKLH